MKVTDYLIPLISEYSIDLSSEQLNLLERYYALLTEWNQKMNLTAITDPEGVAVKHFADSLSVLKFVKIPKNSSVIDVGTGAGFPGVVLKIARPDIKLTLLDSLNKRLVFLNTVLSELGLDAELVHARAEEGAQNLTFRENYDFAVSRAVAQLNILSEYCLPYVRLSGSFIAMKGAKADAEIQNAKRAIGILGGKITAIHTFELARDFGERNVVVIEKNRPTPDKYPRSNGKIKSSPL
jgi:16S rRNA (guanine527-N7)-methyltransferase